MNEARPSQGLPSSTVPDEGFVAGMTLGVFILRTVLLRVPVLLQLADLGYFVVSLALVVRFYFLAMTRAREANGPNC